MSTTMRNDDASFTLEDNEAVASLTECSAELESGELSIIDVPTIYVHLVPDDRLGVDRMSSNLRIVATAVARKVLDLTLNIASASTQDIKNIWLGLAQVIKPLGSSGSSGDGGPIQQFIERDFVKIVDAIDSASVADEHVDVSTCGISFDIIRRFVNDPETKQLVSSEPVNSGGGAVSYSQLPDQESRDRVRRENNDTLLNRLLFCMQHHNRALCFEPNYALNSSIKMMTLAFAYYSLVCASRPLHGYSSNDLKAHYFTYIIDLLVRTRVIKHWQHTAAGRAMLKDLTRNYDSDNAMVVMCSLPSERERVQYVKRLFKRSEFDKLGKALSFDEYLEQLTANVQIIDGERYLNFDTKCLSGLLLTESMQSIDAIIKRSSSDKNSGAPPPSKRARREGGAAQKETEGSLYERIVDNISSGFQQWEWEK